MKKANFTKKPDKKTGKKYPLARKTCDLSRSIQGRSYEGLGGFEMIYFVYLLSMLKNDITLGEICNTLRGVWGKYVAQGF